MGGLFSKPKSPSMPKVPPPAAMPQPGSDASDAAARAARARQGFSKTLITGDLEPKTTKKTLLGG